MSSVVPNSFCLQPRYKFTSSTNGKGRKRSPKSGADNMNTSYPSIPSLCISSQRQCKPSLMVNARARNTILHSMNSTNNFFGPKPSPHKNQVTTLCPPQTSLALPNLFEESSPSSGPNLRSAPLSSRNINDSMAQTTPARVSNFGREAPNSTPKKSPFATKYISPITCAANKSQLLGESRFTHNTVDYSISLGSNEYVSSFSQVPKTPEALSPENKNSARLCTNLSNNRQHHHLSSPLRSQCECAPQDRAPGSSVTRQYCVSKEARDSPLLTVSPVCASMESFMQTLSLVDSESCDNRQGNNAFVLVSPGDLEKENDLANCQSKRRRR